MVRYLELPISEWVTYVFMNFRNLSPYLYIQKFESINRFSPYMECELQLLRRISVISGLILPSLGGVKVPPTIDGIKVTI